MYLCEWMIVVGRMMGQGTLPAGGAEGSSRMMAMIGSTIQLLSNPEELRERIEAIRARRNFTDNNSQVRLHVSVVNC